MDYTPDINRYTYHICVHLIFNWITLFFISCMIYLVDFFWIPKVNRKNLLMYINVLYQL